MSLSRASLNSRAFGTARIQELKTESVYRIMRKLVIFTDCMLHTMFLCILLRKHIRIPERHSLPFQHPHLVGVSGDERRFAEELLFGDGPEVAAGEVLGRGACLQVVLPVQPPQPQQLAVAVERVPPERQRERSGGQDPRRGQDLKQIIWFEFS